MVMSANIRMFVLSYVLQFSRLFRELLFNVPVRTPNIMDDFVYIVEPT